MCLGFGLVSEPRLTLNLRASCLTFLGPGLQVFPLTRMVSNVFVCLHSPTVLLGLPLHALRACSVFVLHLFTVFTCIQTVECWQTSWTVQ